MQNRFRSPVVWAAILAQVLSILLITNAIPVEIAETARQVAAGVLQLGVLVGVLNNPNNGEGW